MKFDWTIHFGDAVVVGTFLITYLSSVNGRLRRAENAIIQMWQQVFPRKDCPVAMNGK